MTEIFVLLILFQIKHFLADYPLQGKYMLGKFKGGTEWVLPLTAHAMVHMAFTYWICIYALGISWKAVQISMGLGLLDFIVHFTVDRIKASPKLLGRFKPDQPYFWWALGWDQSMHHLTHYLIIYILVS